MASQISVNMQNIFPCNFEYPADLVTDLSRQMAAASHASRRLSRGSNGAAARSGNNNTMRVGKPSSTSNSPRSAKSRRTTVSTEAGLARRPQWPMEPMAMPPCLASQTSDFIDPTKRSMPRPLSWHSGFLPQEPQYLPQHYPLHQYPFPALLQSHDLPDLNGQYPTYSPAPTAYSCDASPSSFSPLALPTSGFDTSAYLGVDGWSMPQPSPPPSYAATQPGSLTEPFPVYHNYAALDTPLPVGVDWSSFASQAFNDDNTPLTPDLVPESQLAQPDVSGEDGEADGEILVGMGLYDEPEKYTEDAHLDSSRYAMSSLISGAMPMGKGLKLEEEWAPPPSTDDAEEDEDEEDLESDASQDEADE